MLKAVYQHKRLSRHHGQVVSKDCTPHVLKPSQGQAVVPLTKYFYIHCSVLVRSRNGFQSVSVS